MSEVPSVTTEKQFYHSEPYSRTVDYFDKQEEKLGVRLSVAGTSHIPETQTLFASSHHSPRFRPELDIITNARAFRAALISLGYDDNQRQIRFIGKQELFNQLAFAKLNKLPVVGPRLYSAAHEFIQRQTGLELDGIDFDKILRELGALPINRDRHNHEQMQDIRHATKDGHDLLIFPEGEVVHNTHGRIAELGGGVIYFAQKGKLPITPVSVVYGTERLAGLTLQDTLVRYAQPLEVGPRQNKQDDIETLASLNEAMQANQVEAWTEFETIYGYKPGQRPTTTLLQQIIALRHRPAVTIIEDV